MSLGRNLRHQAFRVTFVAEVKMVAGRGFEPGTHGFSVCIIYASHSPICSYTGIYCKFITQRNGPYSTILAILTCTFLVRFEERYLVKITSGVYL